MTQEYATPMPTRKGGTFSAPALTPEGFYPHDPELYNRWRIRLAQQITLHGMDECWTWNGDRNRQGYGVVKYTAYLGVYASALAHRVAYVLTYGAVPPNTLVLHSCDNPLCVNPRHLRLGTHWDNMEETPSCADNESEQCRSHHRSAGLS
jgi:HNH endonuclease